MTRRARLSLVIASALSLSSLCLGGDGYAQQDAKQVAVERARFKAAQQLYDKGDFAGALGLFRDVVRINGSPNAHLYAGRCLRELGQLPEAYEELTGAMRAADEGAAKETRYVATRDAAAAERAAIASKVALLTIALVDPPPGLVLKVGERAIDAARLSDAIAVAPGRLVVEASADNKEPFRKELFIDAGRSETLAIVLTARAGNVAPPPPAPPVKTGGGLRIAGFAALGLGVVGWGTFAIAGVMADKKYKGLYDKCGGRNCVDPADTDEINAGKTLDVVTNIGLVTGIVGVAGGVVMVIVGGPKEVQVTAGHARGGAALTLSGTF